MSGLLQQCLSCLQVLENSRADCSFHGVRECVRVLGPTASQANWLAAGQLCWCSQLQTLHVALLQSRNACSAGGANVEGSGQVQASRAQFAHLHLQACLWMYIWARCCAAWLGQKTCWQANEADNVLLETFCHGLPANRVQKIAESTGTDTLRHIGGPHICFTSVLGRKPATHRCLLLRQLGMQSVELIVVCVLRAVGCRRREEPKIGLPRLGAAASRKGSGPNMLPSRLGHCMMIGCGLGIFEA